MGGSMNHNADNPFTGRNIKRLTKNLGNNDKEVQEQAKEDLLRIGEPVVNTLIASLKKRNEIARGNAIRVLGDIGDPRAVEPLKTYLKYRADKNRVLAAFALVQIGKPGVEACRSCLNDNDEAVALAAKMALRGHR
jgi:bilin biosynthesis protein